MEERRHFSSRSLLLGALASFVLAALVSAVIGRYWFTLSQLGFAVAIALILAGVERKGGAVWPVLFWGSLAVGVLAILAEGLV